MLATHIFSRVFLAYKIFTTADTNHFYKHIFADGRGLASTYTTSKATLHPQDPEGLTEVSSGPVPLIKGTIKFTLLGMARQVRTFAVKPEDLSSNP